MRYGRAWSTKKRTEMKLIFRGVPPIISYRELRDISPEIVDKGRVGKVEYYITNLGTHPCAYLGVSSRHKIYGKNEEKLALNVHGGLTYGEVGNGNPFSKYRYWFGWDYAHSGDFLGFDIGHKHFGKNDKKWTYPEILKHVLEAIKEIEAL